MSQSQPSTEPVMAGSPYLDDDADIVLRSTDAVHFHVHKLLLSKCSPVFADLFSMPQPKSWGEKLTKGEHPVVQMAEDQHALRLLLGFCYPTGAASFRTLSDIRIALDLTKKYQMSGTWECLTSLLLGHVYTEPESVLAIAWIFEMKDLAVAAAKQTLEKPWLEDPTPVEFDYAPATAMHKLLQYQRSCRAAALVIVSNVHTWLGKEDVNSHPVINSDRYYDCSCTVSKAEFVRIGISPTRWLVSFQDKACSTLEKKLTGAAVRAPMIQTTSIAEAASPSCKRCSSRLPEIVLALEHVSGRLAAAVDAKVATVQLKTPF
ncbi:hypothetical protein EWM64_g5998 [Hericium alpestre]|uniref:BTB domain-containing protein n=1 Tax=Hericium alpestre TaxID=135208 RepID=A0A4Y9ZTV7_9AGAM|nr:hypothetical protein EWM64_g5998 [Hericium alpestre]